MLRGVARRLLFLSPSASTDTPSTAPVPPPRWRGISLDTAPNVCATAPSFDFVANTQAVNVSPSAIDDGAVCTFPAHHVDDEFKFIDTGFRCCFSADPTLK